MPTDVNTIVTIISILVTIYFGIGKHRAKAEVMKLRKYLDYKKLEDFAAKYRDTLREYCDKVERPKWNEKVQGKDVAGAIDSVLTEFNTYLPKMQDTTSRRLSNAIDEAKKELIKVRKGNETARDANLLHLNEIDRILNSELEIQGAKIINIL